MAESERTEAPTPRRIEFLRSQGRVIRSVDLSSALALLAGIAILQQFGGDAAARLRAMMERSLVDLGRSDITDARIAELSAGAAEVFVSVMAPLLLLLPLVGVAASLGQVGFVFSGRAITPDFHRISPWDGLKRLFSARSSVELLKTLAKVGLLTFLLSQAYTESLPALLGLGSTDLRASAAQLADITLRTGMVAGLALLAMAALDYGYQRWEYQRSARMTREELREEMRQTEGSPQIRSRIRQIQRRIANRRMMHLVPTADVIITNPTHLAVALAYQRENMGAPKVVAKGANLLAERIKLLARDHGVPVVENRPLAQALYRAVDIGMEIPAELFQAVAEVLAYIYGLRPNRAGSAVEVSGGAGV